MLKERIRQLACLVCRALTDEVLPEPAPVLNIRKTIVSYADMRNALFQIGVTPMNPDDPLDSLYHITDIDGWILVVPDLLLDSNLYRYEQFNCDDYALAAQVECAMRYNGLNGLRTVVGPTPEGNHAFDILPVADRAGKIERFVLLEVNDGFEHAGELFDIGEYGYIPKKVLL